MTDEQIRHVLEVKDREIARLKTKLAQSERLREITIGLHMPELEQYKYMQALDEVGDLTYKLSRLQLELEMCGWKGDKVI